MTTEEIKQQLCSWDKRNPNHIKEERTMFQDTFCTCLNCQSGRDELANELLRVLSELKDCKAVLFTDYGD